MSYAYIGKKAKITMHDNDTMTIQFKHVEFISVTVEQLQDMINDFTGAMNLIKENQQNV